MIQYLKVPFSIDALIYTKGFGGALRVPTTGIMDGTFTSSSFNMLATQSFNCGGPTPQEIHSE